MAKCMTFCHAEYNYFSYKPDVMSRAAALLYEVGEVSDKKISHKWLLEQKKNMLNWSLKLRDNQAKSGIVGRHVFRYTKHSTINLSLLHLRDSEPPDIFLLAMGTQAPRDR